MICVASVASTITFSTEPNGGGIGLSSTARCTGIWMLGSVASCIRCLTPNNCSIGLALSLRCGSVWLRLMPRTYCQPSRTGLASYDISPKVSHTRDYLYPPNTSTENLLPNPTHAKSHFPLTFQPFKRQNPISLLV